MGRRIPSSLLKVGFVSLAVSIFYLTNLFLDEKKSEKLAREYKQGKILSGEVKKMLADKVVEFVKDQLNVFNKEYAAKKRLGKSVFGVEKYFNLIQDIYQHT